MVAFLEWMRKLNVIPLSIFPFSSWKWHALQRRQCHFCLFFLFIFWFNTKTHYRLGNWAKSTNTIWNNGPVIGWSHFSKITMHPWQLSWHLAFEHWNCFVEWTLSTFRFHLCNVFFWKHGTFCPFYWTFCTTKQLIIFHSNQFTIQLFSYHTIFIRTSLQYSKNLV